MKKVLCFIFCVIFSTTTVNAASYTARKVGLEDMAIGSGTYVSPSGKTTKTKLNASSWTYKTSGYTTKSPEDFVDSGYDTTGRFGDIITKGPVHDVRAYGALCDGVTNDAVAVQAALTAATSGGVVKITGTCAVGSAGWAGLSVTAGSNITIMGNGPKDKLLLLAEPTQFLPVNGSFSKTMLKISSSVYVTVRDLTFDMNNVDANGIGFDTVTDSQITGCIFLDIDINDLGGIMTETSHRNLYAHNAFLNTFHGIKVGLPNTLSAVETGSIVANNFFKNTGNASIPLAGVQNVQCVNNYIVDCGMDAIGIGLAGNYASNTVPTNVRIEGNIIINAASQGINLENRDTSNKHRNISIIGNTIQGDTTDAIIIGPCDGLFIADNVIRNVNTGIVISTFSGTSNDVLNLQVLNNKIFDTRTDGGGRTLNYGIRVVASDNTSNARITISGNHIRNVKASGIEFSIGAGSTFDGVLLSDNMVTQAADWGINFAGDCEDVVISNNILLDNNQDAGGRGNLNVSSSVSADEVLITGNRTNGTDTNDFNIASTQNIVGNNLGKITTTDATVTTLWTGVLSDESAWWITAEVIGNEGASAQRASYTRKVLVYRAGGGSATIQGAVEATTTIESDAGWDLTFDVTGNSVRLRATGAAATTIRWNYELTASADTSTL